MYEIDTTIKLLDKVIYGDFMKQIIKYYDEKLNFYSYIYHNE